MGQQGNWQWCTKCQGLAYAGGSSRGACPASGTHDHTGSYDYVLTYNSPETGQNQGNWQWCIKCQGLAYAGGSSRGACPAGGTHDHTGSFDYMLTYSPNLLARGVTRPQRLLIIAPDEFMSALQPLVEHKNQSGMPTIAVSIASLIPYFQGVDDPETIKKAIHYAYENLSTRYVMLVGDAHCFPVRYMFMHNLSQPYGGDPNNTSISMPVDGDYIPSDLYYANLYHHTGAYPVLANGAFDNWDENGNGWYNEATWGDPDPFIHSNPDHVDGYPDVSVGRVPAHSAQDVTAFVNKVIAYEFPRHRSLNFTFIADQQYGGVVQYTIGIVTNSGLGSLGTITPTSYLLIEDYAGNPPPGLTDASPSDVAHSASQSIWVSYVGHGGTEVWGKYGVFGEGNVAETAKVSVLPVVFAAGCSTGRFISDHPFNGEYVDVAGIYHNFVPYSTALPGVDGPVIEDTIQNQLWGVNCGGCIPISVTSPFISPKPNVYDYDRGGTDQCFAYPWLIANAPGGGIAYFGEIGIAEDPMAVELETYLLAEYVSTSKPGASSPILGDLYLKAQQQYWANHQTFNLNQDEYHSVPRFYLGWMVFFGDPSLRMPELVLPPPPRPPVHLACEEIATQITALESEISAALRGRPPDETQISALEHQLARLQTLYREEGCS